MIEQKKIKKLLNQMIQESKTSIWIDNEVVEKYFPKVQKLFGIMLIKAQK